MSDPTIDTTGILDDAITLEADARVRVYIAAPYREKVAAQVAKAEFEAADFVVTSRWINGPDETDDMTDILKVDAASRDMEDIDSAQVFVILNLGKSEGKATEMGYAYGSMMPVILVGPRSGNIFYNLPWVIQTNSIPEAIKSIRDGIANAQEEVKAFLSMMAPQSKLVN